MGMKWNILLKRLCIAVLCAAPSLLFAGPIKVDGQMFRDLEGRQVILRGINVSGASKVPPFRGVLSSEQLSPLPKWGFNTIRLLFIWEAYEPDRGEYDEEYLSYLRKVVSWADDHGLYVIIDFHQDAFSRFNVDGCGEGFPMWTLPPGVKIHTPDNGKACKDWGVKMALDQDMHTSWHHFYQNTYGVRDAYLEVLRRLGRAFKDSPNVIGFDLLNEPWGWERSEIYPLYRDGTKAVRSEMPNTIMFLSSHALTSTGLIPTVLPKPEMPQVAYSPHYYDPQFFVNSGWNKLTWFISLGIWQSVADRWNVPLFLGEFGVNPEIRDGLSYVDFIYDQLDKNQLSSAQWVYTPTWDPVNKDGWNAEDFSIVDDTGELRNLYQPRPYPHTIPGNLHSVEVDQRKRIMKVSWDNQPNKGALRMYLPELVSERLEMVRFPGGKCELVGINELTCLSTKAGRQNLVVHW